MPLPHYRPHINTGMESICRFMPKIQTLKFNEKGGASPRCTSHPGSTPCASRMFFLTLQFLRCNVWSLKQPFKLFFFCSLLCDKIVPKDNLIRSIFIPYTRQIFWNHVTIEEQFSLSIMKSGAIIRTNRTTELRYKRSPSVSRKLENNNPDESINFPSSAAYSTGVTW